MITTGNIHPSSTCSPINWNRIKMKYLTDERDVRVGQTSSDFVLLSLTLKGVIPRNLEGGGKNPESYETYKVVSTGDLVFCQFDYDVTPRTVGIAFEVGMVTGAYTILVPKKNIDIRFLYYYFLSLDYKKDLLHLCTGLRNTLSDDALFSLEIPLPPFSVQKKIAQFLDYKVARIDEAIAKKKKLLHLLEEKRISLISKAVISGKSHKELKRVVKSIVVKNGIVGKIYMLENIESWTGRIIGVTEQEDLVGELIRFQKDDILFGKLRPYLAKVMLGNEKGSCSGEFLVLRPGKELYPKFLFYRLTTKDFIDQVNSATYGAKMPRASWETVGSIQIALSPIGEQKKIVEKLDKLTDSIEKARSKIHNSIRLLEEYKASLISNAVTGRVKI